MASPIANVADVFKRHAQFHEANQDQHSTTAKWFVERIQKMARDVKTADGKKVGAEDERNKNELKQIQTELKEKFEAVVYGRVWYKVPVNVKDSYSEENEKEASSPKRKKKISQFLSMGDAESNSPLNSSRARNSEDATDALSLNADFEINVLHAAILAQEIEIVKIILSIASECIDNNKTEDATDQNSIKLSKEVIFNNLLNGRTSLKNLGMETEKCLQRRDGNLNGLNMLHLAVVYNPAVLGEILIFVQNKRFTIEEKKKVLNCENNNIKKTPLHFASKTASINALEMLLRSESCILHHLNLEAKDTEGKTPLHAAAKLGNVDRVDALLKAGAFVHTQTDKGKTPLHIATTPKVVKVLLETGADPFRKDENGKSCFATFMESNPDSALEVLNHSLFSANDFYQISTNDRNFNSTGMLRDARNAPIHYRVKYDMGIFQKISDDSEDTSEMSGLLKMGQLQSLPLLKHPLCQVFLHLKWALVRKIFVLKFLAYLIFVLCLTMFATTLTHLQYNLNNSTGYNAENFTWELHYIANTLNFSCTDDDYHLWECSKVQTTLAVYYMALIVGLCLIIKNCMLVVWDWSIFFGEVENIFDMAMQLMAWLFMIVARFDIDLAINIGSFAILLAWIKITALLARFPSFGSYIYMAFFVFMSVIAYIALYFATLIGFACSFYMLLNANRPAFSNPVTGLLKILAMLTGEFEYGDNFVDEKDVAQIIFVLFILLVTIIMGNLIIGLTVNKTEELFQMADDYLRIKKVLNIRSLENLTSSRCKWFPKPFQHEQLQLLKQLEKTANGQTNKKTTFCEDNVPTDLEVCIYGNMLEHRTRPWHRKITWWYPGNPAVKFGLENIFDFKVYIYNREVAKATKYTGHTIPFGLVQETLKLLKEA